MTKEYKNIVQKVDEEMVNEKKATHFPDFPVYKFALREDLKDDKRFLPTRAHDTDTGWDVSAAMESHKDLKLLDNDKVLIPLGFRAFCPEGWWFKLVPRSSTFAKKHLNCLYGTVDQDYHGFVYLSCHFQPPAHFDKKDPVFWSLKKQIIIPFGEKLGQLIPVKRQEMIVEEVTNEEYEQLCKNRDGQRGSGGFGSTDSK